MSGKLQIVLIVSSLVFLGITVRFIRKKGLDLNHSIQWFAGSAILLVMAVFPDGVEFLAHLFGIEVASNFVFLILMAYLLYTLLSVSCSVSRQHDRIKRLVQAQALMEKRLEEVENILCEAQENGPVKDRHNLTEEGKETYEQKEERAWSGNQKQVF